MIKCSEIYTEDLIFDFDNKTPIIRLGSLLNPELEPEEENPYQWVNEELREIFNGDNVNAVSIDYLLNRQDKYISPLFERLIKHYGANIEDSTEKIVDIIIVKFLKGWSKLADAWFADYNPINNYDMVEHENNSGTNKQSTNLTEDTKTSETVVNKYNGFNSVNAVPVSESNNSGEGSKTTSGTQANNETAIDNERELTRSGNIGVTTSQQMIESEFNLRKKNLLNIIYNDIDSVLFLDIY